MADIVCALCERYDEAKAKLKEAIESVEAVDDTPADKLVPLLKIVQEYLEDAANEHIPEAW